MKKEIAKKLIILYVLDIIEKSATMAEPLSITNITKALNDHGITCERRTVSRNIDYLIEYGKPIIKYPSGKVSYKNGK